MAEKKSAGVIKQARKHSKMVGAGLLAAAMSPALMAAESKAELEAVEVRGSQLIRSGYKAPNTTIGKREQDVQNIPQSATVINQQVMQDQATTDLKDALRNADSLNDLRLQIKLNSQRAKSPDLAQGTEHFAIV